VRDRVPGALGAAAALLVAAAAGVLLLGARRSPAPDPGAAGFQRLAGGLGRGTATSLRPCEGAFDPGVAAACDAGLGPLPGGFAYCPHHAGVSLRR
jgi:hypothetical protein